MRNHRLYEVRFNRDHEEWLVRTGKGTVVGRTTTRREAVSIARLKARDAASNFGKNTTLRVRNLDGTVSEERAYSRRVV